MGEGGEEGQGESMCESAAAEKRLEFLGLSSGPESSYCFAYCGNGYDYRGIYNQTTREGDVSCKSKDYLANRLPTACQPPANRLLDGLTAAAS